LQCQITSEVDKSKVLKINAPVGYKAREGDTVSVGDASPELPEIELLWWRRVIQLTWFT